MTMTRAEQTAKKTRQVEAYCRVCGGKYITIKGHDPEHCEREECAKSMDKRKAAREVA